MCGHPAPRGILFIKQEKQVVKLTITNVKITRLLKSFSESNEFYITTLIIPPSYMKMNNVSSFSCLTKSPT